jgi:lambda family phage portal protein
MARTFETAEQRMDRIFRPTGFERALAKVFPRFALERYRSRCAVELSWDAANPGRRRQIGSRSHNSSPESSTNQQDRKKLMWEARSLASNFSFVKSVLLKEQIYVCGHMAYQARTGDPEIDRIYETYWKEWCERCDFSGRHNFRQMMQLGHIGMRRDGDYGWILVPAGDEWRLQGIEADRIGNPDETIDFSGRYISGITINDFGQPVSYRIFRCTVYNTYEFEREQPAGAFIHYFDPMRTDQYRGITAFDTTIPHARDLYELLEFEKMAVKWGSSHAGIVKRAPSSQRAEWGGGDSPKTSQGTRLEKTEAGKLEYLEPGEDITMFPTTSRPSPTFNGFVDTLIREASNGLGWPYAFLWDMSSFGGVSARLEIAAAQRVINRLQKLLEEQALTRIKDEVFSRAIAFGRLPAHPNYRQGKWQFGPQLTADARYEVQSDIALIGQGLLAASTVVGEMGSDYEETLETIAREVAHARDVAEKYDIPLELLMPARYAQPSQLLADMEAANAPQTKPAGLIETIGDKGTAQLVDILLKAAEGSMPREKAISTIMILFKIPRQKAAAMVPEKSAALKVVEGGKKRKTVDAAA